MQYQEVTTEYILNGNLNGGSGLLSIVSTASGNENVLFALANSVLHSASDSVVYTPDMTISTFWAGTQIMCH